MSKLSVAKRLLLVGELLLGAILGAIFFTPKSNGNVIIGIGAGLIVAFLGAYLIWPELRQAIKNSKYGARLDMKNYFIHPTQIPMMIGGMWFLVSVLSLAAFISFFPSYTQPNTPFPLLLLVICPSLAAFGYSGYQMLKRNETVDKWGHVHRGFWAYLNGTIGILFGWGGLLTLLLIYLLDI